MDANHTTYTYMDANHTTCTYMDANHTTYTYMDATFIQRILIWTLHSLPKILNFTYSLYIFITILRTMFID